MYSGGFNRLTSIMPFNAVSSSTISSIVLSMATAPGLPEFSCIAVIGLILFLSLKDILSASKLQEKALESSLNMGIVPLLISFIAMIVYKIVEIL